MWQGEHRIRASVDPDAVWSRWVDPTCWPQYDPDILEAAYDGPTVSRPGLSARVPRGLGPDALRTPNPGATGWLRPGRGPLQHFTVVRADRSTGRFDLQIRYPGATLHVEHHLCPLDPDRTPTRVNTGTTKASTGTRTATGPTADPDADGGTRAATYELVHRIRVSGPAATVWGPLIGRQIVAGLPGVLTTLAERCRPTELRS